VLHLFMGVLELCCDEYVYVTSYDFIINTHPQISLGKSSQGECGGRGM
jgi:hypothetical protein